MCRGLFPYVQIPYLVALEISVLRVPYHSHITVSTGLRDSPPACLRIDTALTMKRVSPGCPNTVLTPPAASNISDRACSKKACGEKINSNLTTISQKWKYQYL